MSKITIIPADGKVGVNGQFFPVDMTGIDADIHAIQFDTGSGAGHIEYVGNAKPNKPLGKTAFRVFEKFVTRWKAASAPPVRTLEQAKADKRQQINSHRDTLEQSGFPYLGKTIDSDAKSVQRITGAAQMAQMAIANRQSFSIDWTCQDNSVVTLEATGVAGMVPALVEYANQLHQHAKAVKAQIDAATTIDQVDAIQW